MKEYLVCEKCGHIVKDYGQEMVCDKCRGKMILVDIGNWREEWRERNGYKTKPNSRPEEDS
jgi:hypothetical protein